MSDIDQVLKAYGISEVSSAEKISGGKINTTWFVDHRDKRLILQRIHPDFRPGMIDDSADILTSLRADGWDVPEILPTKSGQFSCEDDGLWRLSTFINSDGQLPSLSSTLLYECGALLARLHQSLAKLRRTIPAPIPHYRDSAFHIDYLEKVLPFLTGEAHALAENVIDAFRDQSIESASIAPQLIHGDPKLNNMLFRDGRPYTYIDWDTVMSGSPLADIGDFVRSFTKEHPEVDINSSITSFCQGYFDTNPLSFTGFDEFSLAAVDAGKIISLENSARFLYDIVDQFFWEWDEKKYDSQERAMFDQALKSWKIFESLDS